MKRLIPASALMICLSINSFAHEDHDHVHTKQHQAPPEASKHNTTHSKIQPPLQNSPTPKKEAHDHGNHQHDHSNGHSHDHSHSHTPQRVINENQVLEVAIGASKHLTTKDAGLPFGLLPESWSTLSLDNVTISEKGAGYYIASVKNEKEKKTLFLLIGTNGNVYDANFTGEFKGLKKP